MMVISKIWPIAFGVFRTLNTANSCYVSLFPTIFALRSAWVHVSTSHHSNDTSNIELPIDDFFSIITILYIPYINSDNSHIWLGWKFNDSQSWCKDDIIENVIVFEDTFDILKEDVHVWLVDKVWNTYNFEVKLWLGKPRSHNAVIVGLKGVFNIFFNFLEVRIWCYIVSHNDNAFVICTNEVSADVRFDALESMVDVNDMSSQIFNESFTKVIVPMNNDLLAWWALSSYIEPRFGFVVWAVNDILDGIDFFVWEIWKCLLDF